MPRKLGKTQSFTITRARNRPLLDRVHLRIELQEKGSQLDFHTELQK
jgi:hypothetical protein